MNNYDEDKKLISRIKELSEQAKKKKNINESEEKTSIAITNDPKFGNNVLQQQIDNFKQAVNNGAKFSKANEENAEENPLVYFPKTGNLVFSGSIPTLADMKFQFSLNDVTNAPYIFVDGLSLTDETITTINKLRGYFLNWKDEWLSNGDMLDQLKYGQ